jgi:hypothetical protein
MNEKLYYRNPSTGLIETKDFSEKIPTHKVWDKTFDAEGRQIIALKEFASDAALGLLRIADPVSTALVQGYPVPTNFIGDKIFTPVRMAKERGKFPAWGKESFVIPTDLKRAIGGKVARILTQSGSIDMSLSEYALGVAIDNRERNEWAGSPDMLVNSKLNTVTTKIARLREKNQATLATTAGSYATGLATSGASKAWASTGDAVKDMLQLILDVQLQNDMRPNLVWFSPVAWQLWRRNKAVLDTIKFGSSSASPANVTTQLTAQLLEVEEVVVAYAASAAGGKGGEGGKGKADLTSAFLWDSTVQSSNAGCVIRGTGGGIEPAFGYTWERMNSPIVESYYDNAIKSQVWDYEHFFDAAVTKTDAAGLYYALA